MRTPTQTQTDSGSQPVRRTYMQAERKTGRVMATQKKGRWLERQTDRETDTCVPVLTYATASKHNRT